jgi:hypothetical protein
MTPIQQMLARVEEDLQAGKITREEGLQRLRDFDAMTAPPRRSEPTMDEQQVAAYLHVPHREVQRMERLGTIRRDKVTKRFPAAPIRALRAAARERDAAFHGGTARFMQQPPDERGRSRG